MHLSISIHGEQTAVEEWRQHELFMTLLRLHAPGDIPAPARERLLWTAEILRNAEWTANLLRVMGVGQRFEAARVGMDLERSAGARGFYVRCRYIRDWRDVPQPSQPNRCPPHDAPQLRARTTLRVVR